MTTNYEWLLHMDGEERQAWFDAEHVDAHSKTQSKTRPKLSELFGILSDANDDSAPENDVSAKDVDANDENATCNNSGENVIHDSREKLEADMASILHSAYMYAWMHGHENRRGGSFSHIHREFFNMLDRQAAITERECRNLKCWDYCETCELQDCINELSDELLTSNREREHLRKSLGIVLDHAHDMLSLVDINGEVHDRDEGMA